MRPELARELHPTHPRQHQINKKHVRTPAGSETNGQGGMAGPGDLMSLLVETDTDQLQDVRFVVDHGDAAHLSCLSRRTTVPSQEDLALAARRGGRWPGTAATA